MLYVKIKKLTKSLNKNDWFSKNDLFIKLHYGEQCRRTEIKWNNNNPVWNEIFIFEYIQDENIKVQICDDNAWSPIKVLVETILPINQLEILPYTNKYIEYDMGDPIYHYNEKIQGLLDYNYKLDIKYNELQKKYDVMQQNYDVMQQKINNIKIIVNDTEV